MTDHAREGGVFKNADGKGYHDGNGTPVKGPTDDESAQSSADPDAPDKEAPKKPTPKTAPASKPAGASNPNSEGPPGTTKPTEK